MTQMLSAVSISFSIMFLLSVSPLFLSLIIILQTITLALVITMFTMSSWFSFMLLMIYLSGMMVIFIYISSMAANEMFRMNNYFFIPMIIMLSATTTMIFNYSLQEPSDNINVLDMNLIGVTIFKTMKMFSKSLFIMTILLIIYLLLAMIMVSKNSSFSSGPLRSFK
uniref:NADH-ubiquinone oxidoreductase chain 6 n=1 Tax=Pseudoniphargus portosancti TaxID=2056019 RepID=A0A345UE12_9CRUS|nr:NADH dehydrogenase subunit 6 [Pseudoniphargus portosancti]